VILWKSDTTKWEVRQVDGEPWPGKDSEGDTCFTNTHFDERSKAIDNLVRNVDAMISMSVRDLESAKAKISLCEKQCVDAAIARNKVTQLITAAQRQEGL
jgi:hypothetical protein